MAGLGDKYRVGSRIGGGGMAEVLHATVVGAEGFARPVAVKRMLPALSRDPAFGNMFINEARIASLLHHPNIAAVLDFDRDSDGSYFIVMELVPGVDLRRLMASGPVPPAVAALIIADVLRALAYAHDLEHKGRPLGIVHRDISPHNVMVSWEGAAKVVDFGIAKAVAATNASRSGSLKGKVAYMSPEQAHGEDVDGRSDQFAVGVMFHEMLTGRRLFSGATEPEVLARLLTQPIAPPSQVRHEVPADLEKVCLRMLERDRKARFSSCRRALEALIACPSFSPRAAMELEQILTERFAAEAPRRASGPVSVAPIEGTRGTPATVAFGPTPTAAGQRTRTGGGSAHAYKVYWVAGGLGFAVAAAVAVMLVIGGGGEGEGEGQGEGAVAAGGAIAVADAAPPPAAPPVVDAAPVAAVSDAAVPPPQPPLQPPVDKKSGSSKREQPRGTGTLQVIVKPWGQVTVDGKDRGMAPTTLALPAGKYRVRMRNGELGRDETVSVEVKAGETTAVRRNW